MADTTEPRAKGAPTEKMIAAATAAAQRHEVKPPEGFDTSYDTCKAFLDVYLNKPSPKALSFAERIAKTKSLTLPDDARANAKALSAWIDANK